MTKKSSTISQGSIDKDTHNRRARRVRFPQAYSELRLVFSTGNWNWVVPVCLLILALSFNLYRLGVPSIWFDEAFSVELARQPLPLLWQIIFGLEPNMQLYYLFLHGWLSLTGMLGLAATEFVVRLPSAIFAALSTLGVFFLGRHFLSPLVGFVAAGLYLLNDLQLVYAQQTRSYSLQLVLICLAWYAFLLALTATSRQWLWWLCFVVATTLAIYAHLFSLIILLAQVCAYSGLLCLPQPWRSKVRRQIPAFLISLICIFLCIIPLLWQLNVTRTNWLPIPHLKDVTNLLLSISGTNRIYLFVLAICCGLALFVAVLSYLPRCASLPLTGRFFGEKAPRPRRGGGGEGFGWGSVSGGDDIPCGRPRPSRWKDEGRPQGSPPHSPTTPAPTGTRGLLPKNLPVRGPLPPLWTRLIGSLRIWWNHCSSHRISTMASIDAKMRMGTISALYWKIPLYICGSVLKRFSASVGRASTSTQGAKRGR